MQVELYNEVSQMIKYKADKDHTHYFMLGIVIFLFLSVLSLENTRIDLEARVTYLEQQQMVR